MSHSQDTPNEKMDKEKEVLLILSELQASAEAAANTAQEEAYTPAVVEPAVQLTASGKQPAAAPATPASVKSPQKINPLVRLFRSLIPQRGDGALEFFRKCLFAVALMTLISSAVYLIHDSVWIPTQNQGMNEELQGIIGKIEKDTTPEEHREIMQELYAKNDDFRAWLTYEAEGDDFLQISYPVVYSGDNDYYLEHDFNKNYNKNGTLFFDERNTYTLSSAENKVSIIYGHNMISGQMFAHLNQFIYGVSYAKAAPTMTLDTFFGTDEYKVFAVVLIDALATDATEFNYLRTSFANDLDFLYYINQIRARSLYTYDSVSVMEDDELLVLSTCTNSGAVHMDDGRLAVFARKVRVGENSSVDTSQITRNDNVIMPYAWYTNQELDPHPFYGGRYEIPQATVTPTAGRTESHSTGRPTVNDNFQSVTPTSAPPVDVVIGGGSVIPPSRTIAKATTGTTTKAGGTAAATTAATTTTTTAGETTTTTTPPLSEETQPTEAGTETDDTTTASDAAE